MRCCRLLLPLILTGAVLAAGCGGDDDSSGPSVPATTVAGGAATSSDVSDADVEFAQAMIAHHEQAIEMADIALDPNTSARPEVTELANRIQAAQAPEIELMSGWLTAWGRPLDMDTSDGHDMSAMEGMMSAEDMEALATRTGAEFDTMWLEMMIEHHSGAIAMAEEVQANGSNGEAQALAGQIITAQQAEIDEMNALLGD